MSNILKQKNLSCLVNNAPVSHRGKGGKCFPSNLNPHLCATFALQFLPGAKVCHGPFPKLLQDLEIRNGLALNFFQIWKLKIRLRRRFSAQALQVYLVPPNYSQMNYTEFSFRRNAQSQGRLLTQP